MKIEESNKLIAEFDGWKVEPLSNDPEYSDMLVLNQYDSNGKRVQQITGWECDNIHEDELKRIPYLTWDWLMPVVDKIIEIDITPAPNWRGYRIEIVPRGYVKISGFPMPTINTNVSIEGSLINATYKAVIQFIQWYSTQKK